MNRPYYPSLRGVMRDLAEFKRNWDAGRVTDEEMEIAKWLVELVDMTEKTMKPKLEDKDE